MKVPDREAENRRTNRDINKRMQEMPNAVTADQ